MTKTKKKPLPIYLTDDLKEFVKVEANKEGETMNGFVVDLIKQAKKKAK